MELYFSNILDYLGYLDVKLYHQLVHLYHLHQNYNLDTRVDFHHYYHKRPSPLYIYLVVNKSSHLNMDKQNEVTFRLVCSCVLYCQVDGVVMLSLQLLFTQTTLLVAAGASAVSAPVECRSSWPRRRAAGLRRQAFHHASSSSCAAQAPPAATPLEPK